jgi:hypothetical protein
MLHTVTVKGANERTVARFLPSNFVIVGTDDDRGWVIFQGEDSHGWTLEDYVLPRLASGLIFPVEVVTEDTD